MGIFSRFLSKYIEVDYKPLDVAVRGIHRRISELQDDKDDLDACIELLEHKLRKFERREENKSLSFLDLNRNDKVELVLTVRHEELARLNAISAGGAVFILEDSMHVVTFDELLEEYDAGDIKIRIRR